MRNLKMESMHQWLWRDSAGINKLPERCQHLENPFSPRVCLLAEEKIARLCSAHRSAPLLSRALWPLLGAGRSILSTPRIQPLLLLHPYPMDICQLGCLEHLGRNLSLKAAATWIKPPRAAPEGGGDPTKAFGGAGGSQGGAGVALGVPLPG